MTERVLRLVSSRKGRPDDVPTEDGLGVTWDDNDAETLSADDGWRELRRELDRSRRFGHEFVLIRMSRFANGFDLLRALPARLRSVDSVWGVRKQAFVLLPESSRGVAAALVARLQRESPGLLPEDLRFAAFPADGLTGGALVDLLNQREIEVPEARSLDVALHQGLTRA